MKKTFNAIMTILWMTAAAGLYLACGVLFLVASFVENVITAVFKTLHSTRYLCAKVTNIARYCYKGDHYLISDEIRDFLENIDL